MRKYVFADEAGCFAFTRGNNVSRYYAICTVVFDDPSQGHTLLDLRRQMAWEGVPLKPTFHCCEDSVPVRDRVFAVVAEMKLRVCVTLYEKSKAQPQTRVSKERFYQHAWFYHLKFSHPKFGLSPGDELLVTSATVGTRKEQAVFTSAVNDVVNQNIRGTPWKTDFTQASADPCLQVTDYCTWAVQRKWERGDEAAYNRVKHLIVHEVDSWSHGTKHYY
jgi:hypothetical protein